MAIVHAAITVLVVGTSTLPASAQATSKQPLSQPAKVQQKNTPATAPREAPAAVKTSAAGARGSGSMQNGTSTIPAAPPAQQTPRPSSTPNSARLPPATSSQGLSHSILRAPTREELVWQSAQQIYAERLKNDPRVLTLETGPGPARDSFLPWLKKYHWDEAMKQARAEIGPGTPGPH
jgi:hypothetical protein